MAISIATSEDCMGMMARYEDKFFDLAIVDPPYGKKPSRNSNGMGVTSRNFESGCDGWDIKPNAEYFDELFRVSKNQIIWGGNYFIEYLISTNCFIIWDKKRIGEIYAECEMAWASFNTPSKIFHFQWHGMLQQDMSNKETRIHPTQKPMRLYKWLLQNYAKKGDKILDTHLGSGSSRIAAYKLGFDFYSTELDFDYWSAQEKRFKEAIAMPLFDNQQENTVVQPNLF